MVFDGVLPTEDFHLISSCPCWVYTIRKDVETYSAELAKETAVYVEISVSIGSASCMPNDSISYFDFLGHADKALYDAKDAGRNCIVKFEDSKDKSVAA